jgi:UDP-N-acetylmuramyl tripeptide synthase
MTDLATTVASRLGRLAALFSRRSGLGGGAVIGGRLAQTLRPGLLAYLAAGRTTVLVTGTNGKTTTSHLIVAALTGRGPVAHNAAGANMADGAVGALIEAPRARLAVLETDELHLATVLDATRADVVVVLNLSRDQLDRVTEVAVTARDIRERLASNPHTVVVANADDPMVVWAAQSAARVVWVAAGAPWQADARTCPSCRNPLPPQVSRGSWSCRSCGFRRPVPSWTIDPEGVRWEVAPPIPLTLALPGRINRSNATMALAAAAAIGTDPVTAAPHLRSVRFPAGRYGYRRHDGHRVRTLLVKNPAGWGEALDVLAPGRPLLMAVNAREADGRDVSWLWDLQVATLADRLVVVTGERAADLGVRLSYAGIAHRTFRDPDAALASLPDGEVDAVANYTAFLDLQQCGAAHVG